MAVTGTDCTQIPGIGRTFSGYSSMITSSIRVACWNSQCRGTHKFLRVHHVFEETLLLSVCAGQSQRHAPLQQVLVTVSPTGLMPMRIHHFHRTLEATVNSTS
jgi:hypothetical protein